MTLVQSNVHEFALESEGRAGEVPARVIEELRNLRLEANEALASYRDAVKIQAGKHRLKASALRRYVQALASDKVEEARVEASQVVTLIEGAKA
jgi:hypothetical protein